jgi:putative transposase
MPYNPNIHHRRSIRLKGYDYSQAGLYFITICVQDRKCLFGEIVGAGFTPAPNDRATEMVAPTMQLNDFGTIAHQQWQKLPERFTNMELDVFQIMPNHMHGIIMLTDTVGATLAVAPDNDAVAPYNNTPADNDAVAPDNNTHTENDVVAPDDSVVVIGAGASPAPMYTKTIGDIVGAYKSLVANDCLKIFKQNHPGKMMGKLWQRNYWENIIRDEPAYQRISAYIINNPKNWKDDKFYK